MSGGGSWSAEADAVLIKLWRQTEPQLSTQAIADQMGLTKNQVVGRIHRLVDRGQLEPRPSPILRRGEPHPPRPTRAAKVIISEAYEATQLLAPRAKTAEKPIFVAPARQKPASPPPSIHRLCQYPLWGTERHPPERKFCGDPVRSLEEGGGSWCASHAAICLTRVRDRREDGDGEPIRPVSLRGVSPGSMSVRVPQTDGDPQPLCGEEAA